MPHEIERILGAVSSGVWAIEPSKAAEIVNFLALRASGPTEWSGEVSEPVYAMDPVPARGGGNVHVLQLHGTIIPRASMMSRMSGGSSMQQFQKAFRAAAMDTSARAIVIDVNSPGGMVDLVPETASIIRAARSPDRPIIAVANTMAASAAYWLASQADEIVVTPSGLVGSIGILTERRNMLKALEAAGIDVTLFSSGSHKAEAHPFGKPLDDKAKAAIQAETDEIYAMFIRDVAKGRGVPTEQVRADPEAAERHFGGGRAYHAKTALKLGMVDGIATLEDTISRVAGDRKRRTAAQARRALTVI